MNRLNKLLFLTVSLLICQSITCMDIHDAVKQGDLRYVQELLDSGVSVNDCDANKSAPLHYAASYGHADVTLLLLKYGAKVDARADCQLTPLHYAAIKGHAKLAKFLLDHGAIVDARADYQVAPLHCAASYDQAVVALLLLNHRAIIDAYDNNKNTPLDCASKKGGTKVAQLLRDWPYYQRASVRGRECMCAFNMAQHELLGKDSAAHTLALDLYPYIAQFVYFPNPTIEEIHAIAQQERIRDRNQKIGYFLKGAGTAVAAMCAYLTYQFLKITYNPVFGKMVLRK